MKHIYGIEHTAASPLCAAFGRFDGMHKKHAAAIEELITKARSQNLPSALISFSGTEGTAVYTTEEEKEELLQTSGLDFLISLEGGNTEKNRADAERRLQIASFTDICAVDGTEELDRSFEARDFPSFSKLCGRPYRMTGDVMHGKGRGKTVGMPTINLHIPPRKKRPPEGVYATITHIDGRAYEGVTNIGRRPSVDTDDTVTIETFLFDFRQDIYGQKIGLDIYTLIRNIIKFDGLEAVKRQVEKDIISARDFFGALRV
ncbi:riboflavin kinase [Treponema sp. HNW]|uniref:riboflavin kinase n=1 Tax=Treponema sp. HNW TaxID=3116654 RepID=UPI003D0AD252